MTRAFTLVEVMVVVAVLSIMTAIGVFGFSQYNVRATDAQRKTVAANIKAGLERYYSINNEYPSAQALYNSSGTNIPTCNFGMQTSNVVTMLGVKDELLTGTPTIFMSYAGPNCTWLESTVYYLTKAVSDGTGSRAYTFGSCVYTFSDTSSTSSGGASALIMYYSKQQATWQAVKTNRGVVSTSNGSSCPFKTL